MTLWLEEDQYDCKKDLMDLVMMNYDASSCLLVCTMLSILPLCYSLPVAGVFYAHRYWPFVSILLLSVGTLVSFLL